MLPLRQMRNFLLIDDVDDLDHDLLLLLYVSFGGVKIDGFFSGPDRGTKFFL